MLLENKGLISIKRLLDAPFILIDFWLGRLQNENTKNKPRCVCQFINHLHVLCLVTHSCPSVSDFIFWAPKSLQMVTAAMKLKDAYFLEGKL